MKPVASMTGFALAARPTPLGQLGVELRSVNSRFLDLSLRFPDDLRAIEATVRETISARITRGKVECRLSISRLEPSSIPAVNAESLARLTALARQASDAAPDARPLSIAEILGWPGVIESPSADPEALRAAVVEALAEGLEAFSASRQREGAALREAVLAQCDGIAAIAEQVRVRAPELLANVERKLTERLEQALGPALSSAASMSRADVTDRIRQEVILYGMKMDVDEEIKRLVTHVAEVRRVLGAGGPVGRRLDFLMQELNREANTLGSKAAAIEMTNAAVELKLLIEQMREQIQNLE